MGELHHTVSNTGLECLPNCPLLESLVPVNPALHPNSPCSAHARAVLLEDAVPAVRDVEHALEHGGALGEGDDTGGEAREQRVYALLWATHRAGEAAVLPSVCLRARMADGQALLHSSLQPETLAAGQTLFRTPSFHPTCR